MELIQYFNYHDLGNIRSISNGNEMIKQKIFLYLNLRKRCKNLILQQLFNSIFESSYSLELAFQSIKYITVPDLIFVISLFNPLQYQGQFVFLVQQQNLDNQAQLMIQSNRISIHSSQNHIHKHRHNQKINLIDIVNEKLAKMLIQ